MNKAQALRLMATDAKLTHPNFLDTEWITLNDEGEILTEDGCRIDQSMFWQDRSGESWEEGWACFNKWNGQKVYYTMDRVGSAKYTVNEHDGVQTHNDGSPFFGIALFRNKRKRNTYIKELQDKGFREIESCHA